MMTSRELMELRFAVIKARDAWRRNEITEDLLHAVVDIYLDAHEARAKTLWPDRSYRRPTRAYVLRAL
jgi:hypothetical protein